MDEVAREIKELRIGKLHQGVTTAAEWVCDLRDKDALSHSEEFNAWLLENKPNGWIRGGDLGADFFPSDMCLENGVGGTQEFVWSLLGQYSKNNQCKIHHPRIDGKGFLSKSTEALTLSCYPVANSHTKPSFGSRKPDNVFRSRSDVTGAHTIVVLGDNKRRAHGKFTDEEIGHVLDMTRQLLMDYQKRRVLMYCFLTDGYRLQFFGVRRGRMNNFTFLESNVYEGLTGWQV